MSPAALRHLHAGLTFFWIALIPVALLTGLKESIVFIVFASIYANVAGHWAAWQAARAEES